jgi:succinate dehydrogenase / fumarate reductase, membrane anchor subunit
MSGAVQNASLPKSGENTWLWLIKIVTGPLLVVLLLVHFIVNHFIGENGLLTYADVIAYYKNPLIPVMEICFLAAVVTHSLSGLRGIFLDLNPSRSLLKAVDWLLVIVGIVAVVYGAWLALTIASMK